MSPGRESRPRYDERYKMLFAFPRMVQDLVRAFFSGEQLATVDFSTLQKLSAEYVSDELLKRHGDAVWRLRVGDEWAYLLVLLEFQSRDDYYMALRILVYVSLMYQEWLRNESRRRRDGQDGQEARRLPAVLPVVLYNGTAPWDAPQEVGELIAPVGQWLAAYQPAQRYFVVDEQRVGADTVPRGNLMRAVVGLEQSRSPEDLLRVANALAEWLAGSEHEELRRVFEDWLRSSMERIKRKGEKLPEMKNLEEVRMTLEDRVKEWPAQWMREGREQGLAQGLEQGLAQGLEQGREQGLEHERALLRRMAALRFGAEAGERAAALMADIGEADQLADVGDCLVQSGDGDQFLARVASIAQA